MPDKRTELCACDYRTYWHLLVRPRKYIPLVRQTQLQ